MCSLSLLRLTAALLLCLTTSSSFVSAQSSPLVLSPLTSNVGTVSLPLNQVVNFTIDLTGLTAEQLGRLEFVVASTEGCALTWQYYLEKYDTWCGSQGTFPNVLASQDSCGDGYWPYWQPNSPIPAQIWSSQSSCFETTIYTQLFEVLQITRAAGTQYEVASIAPNGRLQFVFSEADGPNNTVRPFAIVLTSEDQQQWTVSFDVTPFPVASGYTDSVTAMMAYQPGYLDSNAAGHFQNYGGWGNNLVAPVVIDIYSLRTASFANMNYTSFNVSVYDETPIPLNPNKPVSPELPLIQGLSTIFAVELNTTGVTNIQVTLVDGEASEVDYTANQDEVSGRWDTLTLNQPVLLTFAQASPQAGSVWLFSIQVRDENLYEPSANGTIVVEYVGAQQGKEDVAQRIALE